ncbi:MAG: TIM barrel protein [Desulfomonilaceae bacterium]
MIIPKLACCNFIPKVKELREYSLDYGFSGVDWTFTPEDLPSSEIQENDLIAKHSSLRPLEIRYHLYFVEKEIGRRDIQHANMDNEIFFRACRVISRLGGRYVTIHIGLDRRQSVNEISWQKTINSLRNLTDFARNIGLCVCLENLPWGWTSRPDLFEKIIRKSSCWGTLDIGHARASQWVASGVYDLEDFLNPHSERVLNAHVYHEETSSGHIAPSKADDVESRLRMLTQLPFCDWWVLELREHKPLIKTLRVVREFLMKTREEMFTRADHDFTRFISA